MAYLIVNGKGPEAAAADEMWFEFDPDNEATLRKIEELLSEKENGGDDITARLAELCEESFTANADNVRKTTLVWWMKIIRDWFTVKGEKAGGILRRYRRPHKRPAQGRRSAGYKETVSFA